MGKKTPDASEKKSHFIQKGQDNIHSTATYTIMEQYYV